MPKEVTAYAASDGTLYTDECEAATRDVELLVTNSPLQENAPFARKLVEWLTKNSKDIRAVLETHERACPVAVAEGTRPGEPEGTREHAPFCQSRDSDLPCDCGACRRDGLGRGMEP